MGANISPQRSIKDTKTFQVTVGTTATQITSSARYYSQDAIRLTLKGHPSNAGIVYVGNQYEGQGAPSSRTITTSTGFPLAASEVVIWEINDPRKVVAIASQAAQTLCVEVGFARTPSYSTSTPA